MTTALAPDVTTDAAFLRDWSKGKPITYGGRDTHSDRGAGDWYRCGTWSVRLHRESVVQLLAEGLAIGTPLRFVMRRAA